MIPQRGGFPHSEIPGYNGCLSPSPGLSQTTTSFIASNCLGIHHIRLFAWSYNLNDLTMRSALSELLQTLPFVLYPLSVNSKEQAESCPGYMYFLPDNRLKYTNSPSSVHLSINVWLWILKQMKSCSLERPIGAIDVCVWGTRFQVWSNQHKNISLHLRMSNLLLIVFIKNAINYRLQYFLWNNFLRKFALSLLHFLKEQLLVLPTEYIWLERQKSEDFIENCLSTTKSQSLSRYNLILSKSSDFWFLYIWPTGIGQGIMQ